MTLFSLNITNLQQSHFQSIRPPTLPPHFQKDAGMEDSETEIIIHILNMCF